MTVFPVDEQPTLWIFGYGSLIWNPGFRYDECRPAFANGYARRMYQGNTYHRGDEKMPGRVATLIECSSASTSGMVFRISGLARIAAALRHLHQREILNGYDWLEITVTVRDCTGSNSTMLPALTCIANPTNQFYLGPESLTAVAERIAVARGCAGTNCEYLFKLAEQIRRIFPHHVDEHIFQLELQVRQLKPTVFP